MDTIRTCETPAEVIQRFKLFKFDHCNHSHRIQQSESRIVYALLITRAAGSRGDDPTRRIFPLSSRSNIVSCESPNLLSCGASLDMPPVRSRLITANPMIKNQDVIFSIEVDTVSDCIPSLHVTSAVPRDVHGGDKGSSHQPRIQDVSASQSSSQR